MSCWSCRRLLQQQQVSDASVVDSIVVTVAPVFLGAGGVLVSPRWPGRVEDSGVNSSGAGKVWDGLRVGNVRWLPMGEDVVMCGLLK